MEREGDRAKKGSEVRRSFVVDVEEGKRVRERFEEGDDRGKGGDVGGRGAVFERGEVDIREVNGHEYVLVPVHRFDGKTSRQVRRRPICFGDGAGPRPLSEGRVNSIYRQKQLSFNTLFT